MKKLIYLSGFLILLCSCSHSQDNLVAAEGGLVKKMVETDIGGAYSHTTTYSYNGNKIISATVSDGSLLSYTYSGDLISKKELFYGGTFLEETETFVYNSNDQVTSCVTLNFSSNQGNRYSLVYNNDSTVLLSRYTGDLVTQDIFYNTVKLFLQGSEIIKKEYPLWNGDNYTTTYTYDGKNNPASNITGMAKISFVEGTVAGALENISQQTSTSLTETSTVGYAYTYNSNNFPATRVYTSMGGVMFNPVNIKYYY